MEQSTIDTALEHGRIMRLLAFEHALTMAETIKMTEGDLDTFIGYMTKKIEEENNGN